jgi:hypothetical protein
MWQGSINQIMKVEFTNHSIKFADFIKLCAIGFICSFGLLFALVATLMVPLSLFTGDFTGIFTSLSMLVLAPIVCGLNGAFFGVIIFIGLKVFNKFKPIEFVKAT